MNLVLSDKDLGKLFVMMLIALSFWVGGAIGYVGNAMGNPSALRQDDQEKHGISQLMPRLGGAVIIGLCLSFLLVKFLLAMNLIMWANGSPWAWPAFLSTSALGLVEV